MRGRLYYTAKAKKYGKVMIKTHPCSRLCFCKCWTCFKEVSGKGVWGRSRGGPGALGLRIRSRARAVPLARILSPRPRSVCSRAAAPSSLPSLPSCLLVESVEKLKPFGGPLSERPREAFSGPLLVLGGRTREDTIGRSSLPGLRLSK